MPTRQRMAKVSKSTAAALGVHLFILLTKASGLGSYDRWDSVQIDSLCMKESTPAQGERLHPRIVDESMSGEAADEVSQLTKGLSDNRLTQSRLLHHLKSEDTHQIFV